MDLRDHGHGGIVADVFLVDNRLRRAGIMAVALGTVGQDSLFGGPYRGTYDEAWVSRT